LTFC